MSPRSARTLLGLAWTIVAVVAPACAVAQKVSLTATPAGSAAAGSTVTVQWTGPNSRDDFVTIAMRGAEASAYLDWKNTAAGSPASLVLPVEPGPYEIRYVSGTSTTVLAAVPYEVLSVDATVTAPKSAEAGGTIAISWTGPNRAGDWITIVEPSAKPEAYASYVDADKSIRSLDAPVKPGSYEIRYVQSSAKVLARAPIEITDVNADVTGPASVAPKAAFDVSWKGPNNGGDWITIVAPSADAQMYGSYVDAKVGTSSATLYAPEAPGTYELRYVLGGMRVIATRAIEVVAGGSAGPASTAGAPPSRTIELGGFAGTGTGATSDASARESASVVLPGPRTISLVGFTGTGAGSDSRAQEPAATLPAPRTISLPGFTATGTRTDSKTR